MADSTHITPSQRDRAIERVLWRVLVVNMVVAAGKLTFGYLTGAVSLLADGIHSLLDASSNVVGLVGIRLGARPPDASHPYGHRRYETLSALTIGLLIATGAAQIIRETAARAFGDETPMRPSWTAASFIVVTVVVNLIVSRYEARQGRRLQSRLLEADAGHTRTDALAAMVVLAAFAGASLGYPQTDLFAAVAITVLIGRTAWRIVTENLHDLTDAVQISPASIRAAVLEVPRVEGVHRIRSRGAQGYVQVDLHIHLDPELPLATAHDICHAVTDHLRATFPEVKDVMVHAEPADGREQGNEYAPGHYSEPQPPY